MAGRRDLSEIIRISEASNLAKRLLYRERQKDDAPFSFRQIWRCKDDMSSLGGDSNSSVARPRAQRWAWSLAVRHAHRCALGRATLSISFQTVSHIGSASAS